MTVQLEFTDVCLFVMCQWFWFDTYILEQLKKVILKWKGAGMDLA